MPPRKQAQTSASGAGRKQRDGWLSLLEAARVLGQNRQTVLTRIVKRELVGRHVAGRTVVSRESVERALSESAA